MPLSGFADNDLPQIRIPSYHILEPMEEPRGPPGWKNLGFLNHVKCQPPTRNVCETNEQLLSNFKDSLGYVLLVYTRE